MEKKAERSFARVRCTAHSVRGQSSTRPGPQRFAIERFDRRTILSDSGHRRRRRRIRPTGPVDAMG
ncbi:hypothetical protein C8039_13250 [Halogeometricum sp. wsp3]|nr:hypothetical protein C8039_13250 [Halogeometricum sp. wsp3]